jgi:hypothetical protein
MATMQPTSWREERRRDRMAEAQISRDNEAARTQARIAAGEAQSKLRLKERQVREAESAAARKQRGLRRAAGLAWLRGHVVDLLFVPVIVVPGVLAWTAMAAYGRQVFGPAGVSLPVFSEGAMWAFAGATTITRHRHPDRPVWHLRAGTVLFAGVGAALNFIHGAMPAAGQLRGPGVGLVMALVSVAGVTAHQLITAGPRRSRAARARVRAERAAARRERAIGRAALRRAVAVLGADGGVRLVHKPGAVALARRWHGRAVLEPVASPSRVWLPWPTVLPGSIEAPTARLLDTLGGEAVTTYRDWRSVYMIASGVGTSKAIDPPPATPLRIIQPPPLSEPTPPPARQAAPPAAREKPATERAKTGTGSAPKRAPVRRMPARQKPLSDRAAKRAKAEALLRANPAMSRADVVAASGVSERTADRIRAELPRHLHVAKG